jgi:hypothetical protein
MRCILGLTLMATLAAAQEPTYDFRSVSWGASFAQVKATETAKLITDETNSQGKRIVVYQDVVAELPCYVVYVFVADQLVRAKYIFTQEHSNYNAFIDDFNRVEKILTDKYGPRTSDLTRWKNNLYQDSPDKAGQAVAAGHLQLGSQWETQRSTILIGLIGDNFKIEHQVEYKSKSLRLLEEELDKATVDKKF